MAHEKDGSATGSMSPPYRSKEREPSASASGSKIIPPIVLSAPPMKRERDGKGSVSLSLRSHEDSANTSILSLDKLSPFSPDVLLPGTPRMVPVELPRPLHPGQSAPPSPPQQTAAGPPPTSKPGSPIINPPQTSRHAGLKRPASKISDNDNPETDTTQQLTRATATRRDSPEPTDSMDLAESLLPVPSIQQELYKIYSLIRRLLRITADDFGVVDPHDFIETLSWSHLQPSQTHSIAIIRRIRRDLMTMDGTKKNILIPFQYEFDVFLASVQVSSTLRVLRIFDSEMLGQPDDLQSENLSGDWSPMLYMMKFVRTLFPEEPEEPDQWLTIRDTTALAEEPLDEPGLVAGHYYDEEGSRYTLQSVLPFFYETLHLIAGMRPSENFYDSVLFKWLFAAFERNPARGPIMERLRQKCRNSMSVAMGHEVQRAKKDAVEMVPRACRGSDDFNQPFPLAMRQMRGARLGLLEAVEKNYKVAEKYFEEYAHMSRIIAAMDERTLRYRVQLRYGLCRAVYATMDHLAIEEAEVWAQLETLNSNNLLALDALESGLGEMRKCLDNYRADFLQVLEQFKSRGSPKHKFTLQGPWDSFTVERGDLREKQNALAMRRSVDPLLGRKRLREARESLREGFRARTHLKRI